MTYTLADGSTCHQYAPTSPMGSDIVNEQCGGAVSVTFQLSVLDQVGDVDMELHQMGFDCSTGPKPAGPLVAPPTTLTSTVFVPSVPVETHSVPIETHTAPMETHTVPVETHKPSTSVEKMSTPTTEPPMATIPTVWTTRVVTVTQCPSSVTDCPEHAPATESVTQHQQTTVPLPVTTSAVPNSPSPPACPDLVPMCLNTWLSVPKCTSNSDVACFCPSSEFTDKFNSCVHAWSSSQEQTDSALSYFAGICAPYVPKNPAIISIVPTTTPSNSVPAQHVTGAPSPTGPMASMASTTSEAMPPCTTLTWSSHTVTVPQVGFSTHTGAFTTVVSLVTGNPATKSSTSHHAHTSCTSSMTKMVAEKTTTTNSPPTSPPKPTSTVAHSNVGSKALSGSLWALGLAIFAFLLQ